MVDVWRGDVWSAWLVVLALLTLLVVPETVPAQSESTSHERYRKKAMGHRRRLQPSL